MQWKTPQTSRKSRLDQVRNGIHIVQREGTAILMILATMSTQIFPAYLSGSILVRFCCTLSVFWVKSKEQQLLHWQPMPSKSFWSEACLVTAPGELTRLVRSALDRARFESNKQDPTGVALSFIINAASAQNRRLFLKLSTTKRPAHLLPSSNRRSKSH